MNRVHTMGSNALGLSLLYSSLLFLGLMFLGLLGCSSSEENVPGEFVQLRQKYMLESKPQSPTTIAAAIEQLAAQPNVRVVGRINAGSFEPWDEGKATFVISEAAVAGHHDHGSGDHAEDCPFCKAKAQKAIVQILDDSGKILAIDARKLLGVQKDQEVIVQGTGKVNELEMLVVTAEGIHIDRGANPH